MAALFSLATVQEKPVQEKPVQEKPKSDASVDSIASDLTKAKQEYESIMGKAKDALLVSFAEYEKWITESSKLSIEERIKAVELLREEKKTFESQGTSPGSAGLKTAVIDYQSKVSAARQKYEKAFDTAADKYLKKDLVAAKAVLAQKKEFLQTTDNLPTVRHLTKDSRRFWRFVPEHGSGYFKKLPNGKWDEIGRNGELMGVWIERGRTKEYVELEDQKRGYLTRLGAGKAWIASNSDGRFGPSPHGDWER
jgi:hypothetical protein